MRPKRPTDVSHRKVAELAEALADDALMTQAAMALRVLFSDMPQIPADGQQMIERVREAVSILAAGAGTKARPALLLPAWA